MGSAILEEHASEAAFLWSKRDAAAGEPHYALDDLGVIDERVEAHLDGLRLAAAAGWEICAAALDGGEAGEVFAAAATALDRADIAGLARVLDVAGDSADLRRGLVGALGWAPFERVRFVLPGLLDPRCPPALHWIGIAACAVRQDPGAPLTDAFYSDDARLRARALRAAGELGRRDLSARAAHHLGDPDPPCRFWAAWSLALLGEPRAAPLTDVALSDGPFADRAATLLVRCLDLREARHLVEALLGREGARRRGVRAAGALGDPALAPALLAQMEDPPIARLAGEAFAMITGADLSDKRLRGKAPEGFVSGPTDDPGDPDVAVDPDEFLPWPRVPAVAAWWAEQRARLPQGRRHLLGQAVAVPWLEQVLRRGLQRQRAAAALDLAVAAPGRPCFEVRAPAFHQRAALG